VRRLVRVLGTGKHLPARRVPGEELDERFGLPPGSVSRKTGVYQRQFVEPGDTTASMGAAAARQALDAAGLRPSELDLIVCASALPQRPLPCTAALIQRELGLQQSGIGCFDVNMTCLSFVTAFDMLSYCIHHGTYRRVLLVSSEIPSGAVNWKHLESSALFGDGAAAVILGPSSEDSGAAVLASRFVTYSTGAEDCQIQGGGTERSPAAYTPDHAEDFLFRMNGPAVFRQALSIVDEFIDGLLDSARAHKDDIALFIPHQASGTAMALLRRKLGVREDQWMDILANHGNCVAASIPMALHEAVTQKRANRGDLVALCGTSAGFSMGGLVFRL
jgi:3-oxoacyl-[acyl-carrier-protein] synthase-3